MAAIMWHTSILSYIGPVAECDLDLTLERKATMNAITYMGNQGVF